MSLIHTKKIGLNMIISYAVKFTKPPDYKLIDYTYDLNNATLSYRSGNAKGLSNFYNKAIMAERRMKTGEYGEAYVMKNGKLGLMTTNRGSCITVTLRSH